MPVYLKSLYPPISWFNREITPCTFCLEQSLPIYVYKMLLMSMAKYETLNQCLLIDYPIPKMCYAAEMVKILGFPNVKKLAKVFRQILFTFYCWNWSHHCCVLSGNMLSMAE